MNNKLIYAILFIFCIIPYKTMMAYQIYDNHVIISMDERSEMQISPDNWNACKSIIGRELPQILKRAHINSGVVSTIAFGARDIEYGINNYISTNRLTEEFNLDNVSEKWNELCRNSFDGTRYSLLSIAKPFSLMSVKLAPGDTVLAENTYLILISDLKYNGNDDFYDELRHKPNIGSKTLATTLEKVKDVQQNYFYNFIGQISLPRGYMMMFECIPHQKYFALESVADYPHEVIAIRGKKGYKVSFDIESLDNPNYELLSVDVIDPSYNIVHLNGYGKVEMEFTPELFAYADTTHIDLRGKVRLIDNVYNRTVLSPIGSELHGARGLNKRIIVTKEPNSKILGMIPIGDTLFKISFWTSNQHTAATVWGIILIVMLIIGVLFMVRRNLKFKNNGSFKAFTNK